MDTWYARTIFAVSDIGASLAYYCDGLGFERNWSHEEDGRMLVAQVSRPGFELILAGNREGVGHGQVFISLDESAMKALETRIRNVRVAYDEIHWGYPSIRLKDPDGNEMIFPRDIGDQA